jgi:hypothetical protein
VFDTLTRWSSGQDRGCAFGNAYAEVGGSDHPAVAAIRAEKAWMRARFTELVTEAAVENAAGRGGNPGRLVAGTGRDQPLPAGSSLQFWP